MLSPVMKNLETKREARLSYKATQEFIAYLADGLDPVYITPGTLIIADPEHWTGWKWNGRESLRFFSDRTQYYVDRKTFLSYTEIHN
jgi:hypothetical protein